MNIEHSNFIQAKERVFELAHRLDDAEKRIAELESDNEILKEHIKLIEINSSQAPRNDKNKEVISE